MEPAQQQHQQQLDVLLEKQQATCTRIALVLPHNNSTPSGSSQGLVAELSSGAITGLVLLYPCCLMLLLEGELEVLRSTLLGALPGDSDVAAAHQAKVLLSAAGLPTRCCRALYSAAVHAGSSSCSAADAADPTQVVQMASRVVAAMRKTACHLAALPEAELRAQLASLAVTEELPAAQQLMALAASEQLPSLADWVRLCCPARAPEQLLLNAVWPLPPPVWP